MLGYASAPREAEIILSPGGLQVKQTAWALVMRLHFCKY